MKKIIAIALALLMICSTFALVSCNKEDDGNLTEGGYVAPSYKKDIGTGIITFADGVGETAIIVNYEPKIHTPHEVVIPEKVGPKDDRTVTVIGDEAFKACTSMSSVKIPAAVTSIGKAAFYNCDNLTKVEIPAAVKTIGELAFAECVGLKEVVMDDASALTVIGKNAFDGCVELEGFKLTGKLTTIESGAFRNCKKLSKVELPESVKEIGIHAYVGCEALNYDGCIILTDKVEDLGGFDPEDKDQAVVVIFITNKEFIKAPEGSYAEKFVSAMRATED